jgi:replicative DNA helicase
MAEPKETGKKVEGANRQRPSAQRKNEDLSNYVFGRVQPQALPLEEAVLGAVMLDKNALTVILDILQPESFYADANQQIFRAMRRLFDRSQPIDLLTVMEELKKSGELDACGGPVYLAGLTHRVASAANIEYHARIIAQKFIQRELIRVSTKTIRDAFEDASDVFELLDEAEQNLYNIAQNNMSRGYESTGALAGRMLKQIEELKDKKDGLTGVPTGFTNLDRLTSGWQPSDLIIVAARPAMGKTGFVLSMARNIALDFKKAVAVFSLEMANLQLVLRLVSMEAEISGSQLRNGQMSEDEWKRLHKAVERISEAPIYIDDTAGINIFELRAKARRMKLQHDIQLIIIDYLQLMSGGQDGQRGNREQEISSISRALKALAKELNVPVIALSQLSRAVEIRGGSKKPQLSDLRESGAIEQDADIVSFIYRPEYYGIQEDEQGVNLKGVAEIIVAKHRNGAVDTVKLRFTDKYARFSDLDEFDFNAIPSGTFVDPTPSNVIIRPSRMNDDEDIPF